MLVGENVSVLKIAAVFWCIPFFQRHGWELKIAWLGNQIFSFLFGLTGNKIRVIGFRAIIDFPIYSD
jgi:hypothetical protein